MVNQTMYSIIIPVYNSEENHQQTAKYNRSYESIKIEF